MKIQFDANQQFQLDAVAAVTDLFDGQPQGAPEFAVINLRNMEGLFAGQDRTELGVGNRLLLDCVGANLVSVQTGRSQGSPLHANTRAIQMRNDIEVADPAAPLEAWELFDGASNWGCRFRSW